MLNLKDNLKKTLSLAVAFLFLVSNVSYADALRTPMNGTERAAKLLDSAGEQITEASSIDALNLSVRAYNVLKNRGVETVGDLVSRVSGSKILHWRNAGPETVKEIAKELERHGFILRAFLPDVMADNVPITQPAINEALLIENLELTVSAYNVLRFNGVNTVGDLLQVSALEMLQWKNLGLKAAREIERKLTPPAAEEKITKASLIDALNLSVRAYNALRNLGIQTVGDLTSRTPKELLKLKNVGKKTVKEIQIELARHGLKLADRPSTGALTSQAPGAAGPGATTGFRDERQGERLLTTDEGMGLGEGCDGVAVEIFALSTGKRAVVISNINNHWTLRVIDSQGNETIEDFSKIFKGYYEADVADALSTVLRVRYGSEWELEMPAGQMSIEEISQALLDTINGKYNRHVVIKADAIVLSRDDKKEILDSGKAFIISQPELENIFNPENGVSEAGFSRFSTGPESSFVSRVLLNGLMIMQGSGNKRLRSCIYDLIRSNASNRDGVIIAVVPQKYIGFNQARRVEFEDGTNAILVSGDYYNALQEALNIAGESDAIYYIGFERILHELCENISALVPLYRQGRIDELGSRIQEIERTSFLVDAVLYTNLVYGSKEERTTLGKNIDLILNDPRLPGLFLKHILTARNRFNALREACEAYGKVEDLENLREGWKKAAAAFVTKTYLGTPGMSDAGGLVPGAAGQQLVTGQTINITVGDETFSLTRLEISELIEIYQKWDSEGGTVIMSLSLANIMAPQEVDDLRSRGLLDIKLKAYNGKIEIPFNLGAFAIVKSILMQVRQHPGIIANELFDASKFLDTSL